MAAYNLVQKVLIHADETTNGGVSPLDVALGTPVKLGSAYPVPSIRDVRLGDERGANADLFGVITVRLSWDGVLVAGESIDALVYIFDIENLGDDLKEILFRCQRLLAYSGGENLIQDKVGYDDQGNMITYRIRQFKDRASAVAATLETDGALEPGEQARILVTQDFDERTADRISLVETLEDLAVTPDIG